MPYTLAPTRALTLLSLYCSRTSQAFLGEPFFRAMENFTAEKGRTGASRIMKMLRITRPLWHRFV